MIIEEVSFETPFFAHIGIVTYSKNRNVTPLTANNKLSMTYLLFGMANFASNLFLMELLPTHNYLVEFVKGGKVIEAEYCDTKEELKVLQAVARSKNCGCEVFYFGVDKATPKEPTQSHQVKKDVKEKIIWERSVRCVETGEIFRSIRECSIHFGITNKSLWNAINSGNARNGLHFVPATTGIASGMTEKKKNTQTVKYLCVTTGEVFDSSSAVRQQYQIPLTSFYKSVNHGRPIKGLLFRKA